MILIGQGEEKQGSGRKAGQDVLRRCESYLCKPKRGTPTHRRGWKGVKAEKQSRRRCQGRRRLLSHPAHFSRLTIHDEGVKDEKRGEKHNNRDEECATRCYQGLEVWEFSRCYSLRPGQRVSPSR